MPKIPYHRPPTSTRSKVDPQHAGRLDDKRFYGRTAWGKLRSLKLSLDPLCERCEREGLTVVAGHVHHVKARKAYPDLALDLDNLEALCVPCHTKEENQRKRDR